MRLTFLNRQQELKRLSRALVSPGDAFVCVYGRRRCGKSRLIREALGKSPGVYYVGDERDDAIQRAAVAAEIGQLLPAFDAVTYPDWAVLLDRWWTEAPTGAVLALDEFPTLVSGSPSLPGVLQKFLDRSTTQARKLVVCGSSQRMMQGLVLDSSAPLYGRAREILKVEPLDISYLEGALGAMDAAEVVEHHAVWGGVPRYWELAAEYADRWEATVDLLLDPQGVLHREPERLLRDDHRDLARVASILILIGQGCHRISEIGARLGLPATSLSRPMARLVDLGLVVRETPFGRSPRDSKRSFYRIADPLLRFWYRFVEPNRSRLEAGQVEAVTRVVQSLWPQFLGGSWEDLARSRVPRMQIAGRDWLPAARWWGPDDAGHPLELDIVARDAEAPHIVLVGEVKRQCAASKVGLLLAQLEVKARRCPAIASAQHICRLWVLKGPDDGHGPEGVVTARHVVDGAAAD